MANNTQSYDLTEEAISDLGEVYDYTFEAHGIEKAEEYLFALKDMMQSLGDNPKLGRERTEIRPALRSFPKGEHVIFYRIVKGRVRVIRLLHGSRDIASMKGL